MKYQQTSFIGGLNRQFDPTKIGDNEYPLLINGRIRNDQVETVQLPEEITYGLPEGEIFQGLYAAGFYLLAFIDGKAYYRNFGPGSSEADSFVQIPNFLLDTTVDRIYAELIPGSTVNFKRQVQEDEKASSEVDLTTPINGSPDSVYVTDGINQGRLIFPNATSRITQNFLQWNDTSTGETREYVPIGTFPMYYNGILYQAVLDIPTGRINRIVRSITGRPLDYMIIIDSNGNKLASELLGGADRVSHRVDYNTITALNKISAINNPQITNEDPPFLVSTAYNSYLVTPITDTSKLIYGEPKFKNRFLFSTGALNPFCVIDEISGNTLLIDSKGIISFNAALLAEAEGRNEPFSRKIHPLFDGITQTVACCTKLDNYIYFGVNTVYGPAIVVYDEINKTWVSLDIYPDINLIKQFAVISTTTVKRLFFITIDNKLYEAFASDTTATCRIYCGEWEETTKHQKVLTVQTTFKDIYAEGQVHATLFTDGEKFRRVIQPVEPTITQSSIPLSIPFGRNDEDNVQSITFGFQDSIMGNKHGVLLEWNFKGILTNLTLDTGEQSPMVDARQDSLIQQNKTSLNNSVKIAFVGWAGLASVNVAALVANIKQTNPNYIILCGNNNLPAGALATLQSNIRAYWEQLKLQNRVYGALGELDLNTNNGNAQITYFLTNRYFTMSLSDDTDIFVLNSGWKTGGTIVEPDGITANSQQAIWLRTALSNSTKKWKIVVVWDTPYYSTLGFNDWPYKQWGASLVIGARNRNYERLYVDQFTQINIGTGSVTHDTLDSDSLDDRQYGDDTTLGYFLIEADNINLNGTFYASPSNEVQDQLQILG